MDYAWIVATQVYEACDLSVYNNVMVNKSTKHTGPKHQGGDQTSPYPVSRLAPQVELVDLAKQIDTADAMINTRVSAKLKLIVDQIKTLQQEARQALEEARQDQELHRAECQFKRIPGKIYHLYVRADGRRYFSMLSPDDWYGGPPHQYLNSYRLENDMSWLPVDQIQQQKSTDRNVDEMRELVNQLLLEKGL